MGNNVSLAAAIDQKIYFIRGARVMLDSDLAEIYGVTTKRLNEQVKRNFDRFPEDFCFKLTIQEAEFLRSQIVTSNLRSQNATSSDRHGGRRYLPYAFTEHGAVMLASVLNSATAVEVSVQVVRAFVRLRSILAAHKELAYKLEALEKKYDNKFRLVFATLQRLMQQPEEPKNPIGFREKDKDK